jgi:hypothetical protein
MIDIVGGFGAPVIDPGGKSAPSTSARSVSTPSSPSTSDVSVQNVSYRSRLRTLSPATDP